MRRGPGVRRQDLLRFQPPSLQGPAPTARLKRGRAPPDRGGTRDPCVSCPLSVGGHIHAGHLQSPPPKGWSGVAAGGRDMAKPGGTQRMGATPRSPCRRGGANPSVHTGQRPGARQRPDAPRHDSTPPGGRHLPRGRSPVPRGHSFRPLQRRVQVTKPSRCHGWGVTRPLRRRGGREGHRGEGGEGRRK